MVPVSHGHHTTDLIPGATLRTFPGDGHISMITKVPHVTAELVALASRDELRSLVHMGMERPGDRRLGLTDDRCAICSGVSLADRTIMARDTSAVRSKSAEWSVLGAAPRIERAASGVWTESDSGV
jgi:hypothetical protein